MESLAATAAFAIENARLYTELQVAATSDPLTGLHNRRYFFDLAAQELSRARRYGRPLSAIMLDIDQFKRVNDTYGHAVGDSVLVEAAAVMGAEMAVPLVFRKDLKAADDPKAKREELIEEYQEKFSNPYRAAERLQVDEVIVPAETRKHVIRALDLTKSKLVTLSACQTALGPEATGGEIMGLAQAFIRFGGGVPSVVASLWKVDDEATSDLMTAFYDALLGSDEPATRLDALRNAKRELLDDPYFAHPYFWAPFILIGDAR